VSLFVFPVGFPNWSSGVLIGASAFAVLVTVTVIIVVRWKKLRYGPLKNWHEQDKRMALSNICILIFV